MKRHLHGAAVVAAVAAFAAVIVSAGAAQPAVTIPEFWSEELLHDYELPLATPENTPKHISRDYYYALPERVLDKSYPIYHPSREPAGYLDRLRTLDPEPAFDPATFKTEAEWITVEDWFDPRRLRDDYVPTGWVGFGVKTRAVKGHPYGLNLPAGDRAALIAFLKTL